MVFRLKLEAPLPTLLGAQGACLDPPPDPQLPLPSPALQVSLSVVLGLQSTPPQAFAHGTSAFSASDWRVGVHAHGWESSRQEVWVTHSGGQGLCGVDGTQARPWGRLF